MRHAFRQHTGLSPHQYQLQLRLNRAKSLLRGTGDSVKEIADQIGFDCPFHFSHLFKSKTGLSPSIWRNDAQRGRQDVEKGRNRKK
jgi:transcriptional regulator GlxA family with amidase domain